jgi:hypothetical protein
MGPDEGGEDREAEGQSSPLRSVAPGPATVVERDLPQGKPIVGELFSCRTLRIPPAARIFSGVPALDSSARVSSIDRSDSPDGSQAGRAMPKAMTARKIFFIIVFIEKHAPEIS